MWVLPLMAPYLWTKRFQFYGDLEGEALNSTAQETILTSANDIPSFQTTGAMAGGHNSNIYRPPPILAFLILGDMFMGATTFGSRLMGQAARTQSHGC